MSAHIETMGCDASVYILGPGAEVGEDVIEGHALAIDDGDSVLVVEGSLDHLAELAYRISSAVQGARS